MKEIGPLIHCITNYVTANDCANILLASGAQPVMADDIHDVREITQSCDGLLLNMGTMSSGRAESMLAAGKIANERSIPIVLDPVGAGATAFRREVALKLLQLVRFDIIKGNAFEINTIAGITGKGRGVDAEEETDIEKVIDSAKTVADRTGAIVAVTGAMDVVSDGSRTAVIHNGHVCMKKVTGMGCMLGAYLTGRYAEQTDYGTVTEAVSRFGYSGELAYEKMKQQGMGIGSYRAYFLDEIERQSQMRLKEGEKIEYR